MSAEEIQIEHHETEANGIRLHYVASGPAEGPLLVFLHGFPEFWYGWRKQIAYFARRGYRVIAPDQRGYNESDRPEAVSEYVYEKLGEDIVALVRGLGRERACIVGHDWGGVVAWWLAANRPGLCEKVAILNVPRPDVLARALRGNLRQLRKSWYVFFFQLPWIAERAMRRNDFAMARRSLTGSSRKGTFRREDLERYMEAWSKPGALTGMVNWYRASFRTALRPARFHPIEKPLLLIWGKNDRFLGSELAEPSLKGCVSARIRFIEDATHWVQHEEPDAVNGELEAFFLD